MKSHPHNNRFWKQAETLIRGCRDDMWVRIELVPAVGGLEFIFMTIFLYNKSFCLRHRTKSHRWWPVSCHLYLYVYIPIDTSIRYIYIIHVPCIVYMDNITRRSLTHRACLQHSCVKYNQTFPVYVDLHLFLLLFSWLTVSVLQTLALLLSGSVKATRASSHHNYLHVPNC